ncbi:MAG TPA: long-chain fatty acid--CoA ligase [Microvirga sp.]|jgi:long-chain acyl-CoA synthetase|nr:long-chain fatty acid--CoA ligase [Microvirga sp.]
MNNDGPLPFVHATVIHMLRAAALAAPQAEALVCGDERLTYAAYWQSVAAFAKGLEQRGSRGGRVAVLMGNSIDTAIACFAVQAAGAQLVPLNPAYTGHELRFILQDAEPDVMVHETSTGDMVAALTAETGIRHRIEVGPAFRLFDAARHNGWVPDVSLPEPDALALLQYTGGTTGRPKGVMLSHRAVATNVSQREALLPTRPDDRVLAITPLFHSYASAMGLSLAAYAKATLVVLPRYRPQEVIDTVARERISLFAGSPTIFNGLMAHEGFPDADWSSLRLTYSGSAALPEETLRRWEVATGAPVCEGYGQTEAGPVLTYNPQDGVRKIGSVGVPLPGTQVQVVDVESGTRILQAGELGEVRARGPQIMAGYRNRPDETAAALRDGFLYTGDIGTFDEDGYLFIRDRKKEMVIVAGFNVYPREVEETLHAHEAVSEAAVVGRPDPYRGEALVAFVVPRPGRFLDEDILRAHLADRLVRYKLPSTIHFVESLPRTTVGKIDKIALRKAAENP